MERNPYSSRHRRLYYAYNTLGSIIGFITFISFKLVPILTAVAAIIYFKKKIGDESWAKLIGVGIFWIALGLIGYPIIKYIGGFSEYFFDQAGKYKKSYSVIYGRNFKEPSLEDFGLNDYLYKSFNHYSGDWALTSIAIILLAIYIETKLIIHQAVLFIFAPVVLGIASNLLLRYISRQLKKQQPQYENVKRYEEAKKIYEGIQQEIRREKFREEYEEKERRRKILTNRR